MYFFVDCIKDFTKERTVDIKCKPKRKIIITRVTTPNNCKKDQESMVAYANNGCIGQNQCSLNMTRIIPNRCWSFPSGDTRFTVHYECVSSDRFFQNCKGSLFVQNSTNLDQQPPNEQCVSGKQYVVSNRENEECSIDVDMAYLPENITVKVTILYCSVLTRMNDQEICKQSMVTNKTFNMKSVTHWNLKYTRSTRDANLGLILQLEGKSKLYSCYNALCI